MLHEQRREPFAFLQDIMPHECIAHMCRVTFIEHEVETVKHPCKTGREIFSTRDLHTEFKLTPLSLCSNDALRCRILRKEKCATDLRR